MGNITIETDKKTTSKIAFDKSSSEKNPSDDEIRFIREENEIIKVFIGEGDKQMTFIPDYLDKKAIVSPTNQAKLKKIYDLIMQLNIFIPSKPVKKITSERDSLLDERNKYVTKTHEISIVLNYPFYPIVVTHEMGHAIFAVLLKDPNLPHYSNDKDWQNMYFLSLGFKNYGIFIDSEYTGEGDGAGHPFSNPSELFASSVLVFKKYPERFFKNVIDPNTPKETKKLGKLIFCYLRDHIFKGIFIKDGFYAKGTLEYNLYNPFKEEWEVVKDSINDNGVINSLIDSLKDENWSVREAAAISIGILKDKRLVQPLSDVLLNGNAIARAAAAEAIGQLGIKDERFVSLLINALKDKEAIVRNAAADAIGQLGIKDERFVQPLIDALKDENKGVLLASTIAIGLLGIKTKRFIEPLIDVLKDDAFEVRLAAIKTVRRLGIKDIRFVQPLIDALKVPQLTLFMAAMETIGSLGIKDERFILPLINIYETNYEESKKYYTDCPIISIDGNLSFENPYEDLYREAERTIKKLNIDIKTKCFEG